MRPHSPAATTIQLSLARDRAPGNPPAALPVFADVDTGVDDAMALVYLRPA